jgi:hypothetical protein
MEKMAMRRNVSCNEMGQDQGRTGGPKASGKKGAMDGMDEMDEMDGVDEMDEMELGEWWLLGVCNENSPEA